MSDGVRKRTDRRDLKKPAQMAMLKVKVKPTHAKKLAQDSKRTGRKVDDLLAAILDDFFRGWRSDKRWMFYQQFK
jgi:hypothetical protein